jgi:hypothetical protein
MTTIAKHLSPNDLGRTITVHDAVFHEPPMISGGLFSSLSEGRKHAIASLTGPLTQVSSTIKVEPGKLFRKVRTIDVRVGSMNLVLDANSPVEFKEGETITYAPEEDA